MSYDPTRHHRRSVRLRHYDYAQPGAYFVTICTHHRACLLGAVAAEAVRLSAAGRIVQAAWNDLPRHYPHVALDAFVVMPNHLHGIIQIIDLAVTDAHAVGADPRVRPVARHAAIPNQGAHAGAPLPRIVQWWKTMTTNAYIRGVRVQGWPRFDGRLWQRNYWERVLRDERELGLARDYILQNPLRWHLDRMPPARRAW